MELKFLDANPILRLLTQDQPAQSAAARLLFEQVSSGNLQVTTSESIIVEVVQVLSSKVLYNIPRHEIQRDLNVILALKGLRLAAKRSYRRALELYASSNVDFVDALTVAQMERQRIKTILSFDRDFDRFPSVVREEPTSDR